MVFDNTFKCTATGKYYKVDGTLFCSGANVVYLNTCQFWKLQYVGSTITFKERFGIHKSGKNTGKKCSNSECKFDNLKIQLIESVNVPDILLE